MAELDNLTEAPSNYEVTQNIAITKGVDKFIDTKLDDLLGEIVVDEKAKARKEWAVLEEVVGAPSRIEKIAKDINIPRTTLIRNLALSSLKNAKFLNNFGILKGTKKLLEFEERLRNPKKYPQLEIGI